jgi:hypothetical protein
VQKKVAASLAAIKRLKNAKMALVTSPKQLLTVRMGLVTRKNLKQ